MDTKILLNEVNDSEYISIIGKATMNTCKTISDIIDILIENKRDIVIDLTECKYIDSTFLGLLADTTIKLNDIKGYPLVILNPNSIVLDSITNTGMKQFFNIKNDLEVVKLIDKNKIQEETKFTDKKEHAKYVLKMHSVLSSLNEENKKVFENVIKQMELFLKKDN